MGTETLADTGEYDSMTSLALLSVLSLLAGTEGAWDTKKEDIPFEELEAEYKLIQAKKSKLSRSQRDAVERMYKRRLKER